MNNKIRRQLTLFVKPEDAIQIEKVRQTFNPHQFNLIPAHVTLCREDEIADIDTVINNLNTLNFPPIEIEFETVKMFDNENGVLLTGVNNSFEFQELRKRILMGIYESPGKHEPHITLMHPRNSNCTPEIFEQIKMIHFPEKLKFNKISLIEQVDGRKWEILQEFELNNSK